MFLPIVIAHRGASGYILEGTLQSFQTAKDMQADMIELDVQITNDDQIIVFHDNDLSRLTNQSSIVHEMTLKEIKDIDLGEDLRIPLLSEVLDMVKGHVGVNIELKMPGIEDLLLDIVKERNMLNDVMFSSFFHGTLITIRELNQNVTTAILYNKYIADPVEYAKELQANAINPLYTMVEKELVSDAHKEGINVFPWTVNDRNPMSKLLDIGVDGIITDFPDVCGEVIMEFYHRHRLEK
ncbi:MAG: glycerophosphodiester phosphodiesterase [Candidatus Thorarchaeota archaeon]